MVVRKEWLDDPDELAQCLRRIGREFGGDRVFRDSLDTAAHLICPATPVVDLRASRITFRDASARLSGCPLVLANFLSDLRPHSHEACINYVWGAREPENVRNSLAVHVCHARSALKSLGLSIQNHRAVGYQMVAAS
jgi:DNA-binding response OmpR family regulator